MSESKNQTESHQMQPDATSGNKKILSERELALKFLMSRQLSERQLSAIDLMLQGLSDAEVGAQLGVDRTTIFRWRKNTAFAKALAQQRQLAWERTTAQMQTMIQPALEILFKQMSAEDEKVALRAAGMLLRMAAPARAQPSTAARDASRVARDEIDEDLEAYINAPMPGPSTAALADEYFRRKHAEKSSKSGG